MRNWWSKAVREAGEGGWGVGGGEGGERFVCTAPKKSTQRAEGGEGWVRRREEDRGRGVILPHSRPLKEEEKYFMQPSAGWITHTHTPKYSYTHTVSETGFHSRFAAGGNSLNIRSTGSSVIG